MADDEDGLDNIIDLASQKSRAKTGWITRLKGNDQGIFPTIANALIILENDPALAGLLGFNEFACRPVLLSAPPASGDFTVVGPFPRSWDEADKGLLLAYFQRLYSPRFKPDTIGGAMTVAAASQRFHPVREYLAGLEWDGRPRLHTWLVRAFGCTDDAYHRAIGTKFLLGAIRRVREPGCKFDTVLLLEGAQDLGKSRACRALFGDTWFTDTLPSDLRSRDAADALTGVWGVEFAEIEHLLRAEPEESKAFISRQIDRYYPRYSRGYVERPRQCVFIGTTNRDDYARDPSGNRRLWPAACRKADVGWLAKFRDQLWAEAAFAEPEAMLWLEEDEVRIAAKAQQSDRYQEDPWEDQVLAYLVPKPSVTVPEILIDCLALPVAQRDKRAQMRVADILRSQNWRRNKGGPLGRRWSRE